MHILRRPVRKQIRAMPHKYLQLPPPPDNIRVMVIVWRLRGNIIRTALCGIVWHNVHSQQHTYVSSSYRSNRLGLSHGDSYTVCRGGCLELYYCNMVEWFWWDSSLILTANWFPSVLWHCWLGHLDCKNRPQNDLLCVEWDVKPYTLTHCSSCGLHRVVNPFTADIFFQGDTCCAGIFLAFWCNFTTFANVHYIILKR